MISRATRLLSRIDRARDGLAVDAGLYAVSAAFALITGLTSTLSPHRAWGLIAVWAYAAALVVVAALLILSRAPGRSEPQGDSRPQGHSRPPARSSPPRPSRTPGRSRPFGPARAAGPPGRTALTWLTWAGAALLPLIIEAVQRAGGRTDRAQDEVLVVERMGERLLHTGTPYLGADAIAAQPSPERLLGYAPYQPGMAIFGLPRAAAGVAWYTDARVWFALVTAAALVAAMSALRTGGPLVRAVQSATVLPICALTLATGGDDLPVLALCLLALAWCATDRFGPAGVAVGAAAACKLFAFPVVAVLAVLAVATGRGRRFLPGAIGLPVLVLIPPLLVNGNAFVENVIRFPLGHGIVRSPAQSPFPGYLIASSLPGGRYVASGLLIAVAVAIAVLLLRRPPRTAATAALFCAWGLLAAILLMPTTRFGYLLYPIALLVWAPALTRPVASPSGSLPTSRAASQPDDRSASHPGSRPAS